MSHVASMLSVNKQIHSTETVTKLFAGNQLARANFDHMPCAVAQLELLRATTQGLHEQAK